MKLLVVFFIMALPLLLSAEELDTISMKVSSSCSAYSNSLNQIETSKSYYITFAYDNLLLRDGDYYVLQSSRYRKVLNLDKDDLYGVRKYDNSINFDINANLIGEENFFDNLFTDNNLSFKIYADGMLSYGYRELFDINNGKKAWSKAKEKCISDIKRDIDSIETKRTLKKLATPIGLIALLFVFEFVRRNKKNKNIEKGE